MRLVEKIRKPFCLALAAIMLFDAVLPTSVLAIGGPSQPEVEKFEPVGTSDKVDVFSGDFTHNIPLMQVGDYPINISYHSGITMDQEASWVGLGWNINPGVINRGMRGIPDDFKGDEVVKEQNMKPNKTYGLNAGAGLELLGFEKLKAGINYSIGLNFNTYSGIGIEKTLNLSLSGANPAKSPLSGGLGLSSSSDNGLTIQPSLSFSKRIAGNDKSATTGGLSASIGTAFNSRAGLKTLSINTSANVSFDGSKGFAKATNDQGKEVLGEGSASLSKGASAVFDFGMPTFVPQAGLPMHNLSVTGNFKLGGEIFGLHANATLGGYYSSQKLATSRITSRAYGYLNSEEGEKYEDAMLDFNREKDGSFTESTPALPLTNFTYDMYSVSGQGVGGSYRPFRGDLGHVFDPAVYTTSEGYSIGGELGLGNLTHIGADVTVNDVNTRSGRWSDGNLAASRLTFREKSGLLYEKSYFKEANEKSVDNDPAFFASTGSGDAKSISLRQVSKFNTIADASYKEGGAISSQNTRAKRERRNQPVSILTKDELNNYGLDVAPGLYAQAPGHHMAEITTTRSDGARYVYGIAAYNTKQEETSFAVGKTSLGLPGRNSNPNTGLVKYFPGLGDNSTGNKLGIDNYYSSTTLPPFAHSYLLTAVLSPDYVDNDGTPGPTAGDIGNYTRFNYVNYTTPANPYKWRVPMQKDSATFNEGLKSDEKDDRANYLYGEKELWYVTSIESKNYIAVFTLEDRKDGFGVMDRDGGINTSKAMKLLRKISLFSMPDFKANPSTAVPLQEVHFEYDYSLCPNLPSNSGAGVDVNGNPVAVNSPDNVNAAKGKLTLKKIFFTYQGSNKARFSPYVFTYADPDHDGTINPTYNPSYNIKGYDRWGNFKPNPVGPLGPLDPNISTAEYPYVDQDKTLADRYTQAWTLTMAKLPSGGKMKVEYESDDYANVQNKRAMQMFTIAGADTSTGVILTTPRINISNENTKLFFNLQPGSSNIDEYFKGVDFIYFRFLMEIIPPDIANNIPGKYEYVPGYAEISKDNNGNPEYGKTGNYGWVRLKKVKLQDSGSDMVNPITKAAIQFGRLNTPTLVWSQPGISDGDSFDEQLLRAMLNSSFFKNIKEAIEGPNKAVFKKGYCRNAVIAKSWIRLNNPNHKKLGGGCRVKKISVSDEWADMTGNSDKTFSYGQEYLYTLEDGTSSGIAAYEPQLGGDENPWKRPVFFDTERLLAPDDEHYMEEPFGESFFPSPNVGYSRVTVKNLQRQRVRHNATGKVVHEFYTANDFPTITERTDLTAKREKDNPISIASLLRINVKDYMTASQGYVIELNDMHGKPKKQEVFQEGQTTPISSVEYRYKSQPYLNGSFRLDNTATTILNNGNTEPATIGVFFDFVSDMREHKTTAISASINGNVDGFVIPPVPAPIFIPIILPAFSSEKTRFRSAVVTKVIQRFGILEETIARDLGSTVSTKNLAYDAETGDVLLTQTTTDFNDAIFSFTFPAHWYYDGMGPSYRNEGFSIPGINFNNGVATVANAGTFFSEGDELALSSGDKAWVLKVNPSSIEAVDEKGSPVSGTFVRILRSGRKNQQVLPMASLTLLSNPLDNLKGNIFNKVLQAEAIEYSNSWRTFCDCFTKNTTVFTTNPYVLGTKGMFKKQKSHLHLTGRIQSNYDNNTNIRKDGVFTSFTPFYRLNASKWEIDDRNWTFTSEVTEFSPFGSELENRDALGRYSSAIYGYNQTLSTAVAANSRYSDAATDNFEDYDFSDCADNHFKFNKALITIDKNQYHTGSRSIKVSSGTPAIVTKQLVRCDTVFCDLQLASFYESMNQRWKYTITGGAAPLTFDWTFSGRDLSVTIGDTGDFIYVSAPPSGASPVEMTLTVIDSNQCRKIFTVMVNPVP